MENTTPLPVVPVIEGDPVMGAIIKILRDAREKNEEEDLEYRIEAARSIA